MESKKVIINNFLKETHSPAEIKDALFRAAEAAMQEGWTFMETSFQLGEKAKEEGLPAEEIEVVIRRAFSEEKRSREREEERAAKAAAAMNAAQAQASAPPAGTTIVQAAVPTAAASVLLDPRLEMMGLDTQSLELLQNHRIDPEALNIPWPSADWRRDLAKLLEAVFLPGETIAFKMSNTAKLTEEKVSVITSQPEAIRKIMKSLDGPEGALLSVNATRSEENFASESFRYRYVMVDNPKMPLAKQLAYYKALNIPCAALVNTGANSVQAWVKIEANDSEEYADRVDFLFSTLEEQGFKIDEANKRNDCMVRMPGVLRNGKQQYLICLDQGAKNFAEWKEWVEYSLDGKPLIEQASDCAEAPKQEAIVLEGALRAGELMLLSAPPKAGKSFALIDLALSVCAGKSWLGYSAKPNDVLFVNFELSRPAFLNRLFSVASNRGISPSTEKLGFLNLRGNAMSPLEIAQYIAKRVRGAKKLEGKDYKVIIIDPLSSVLHSPKLSRNTSGSSQILMQMADSILSLTGSAVVTSVNLGEFPYLETRADSHISLIPMEGTPNIFQVNGTFREFPNAYAKECTWMFPQFVV